jgi:hypothetical protein
VSEIKVPFTRALTVLLTRDISVGQAQADSDLAAIETSQVIAHPTNEGYFHRLRLRVAENPALAEKIAVFYQDEKGKLREIGLHFEDELRWPPGFMQELWEEEMRIREAEKGR